MIKNFLFIIVISACFTLQSMQQIATLKESTVDKNISHTAHITAVCTNVNGNILFTADREGTIKIWMRQTSQKDIDAKMASLASLFSNAKIYLQSLPSELRKIVCEYVAANERSFDTSIYMCMQIIRPAKKETCIERLMYLRDYLFIALDDRCRVYVFAPENGHPSYKLQNYVKLKRLARKDGYNILQDGHCYSISQDAQNNTYLHPRSNARTFGHPAYYTTRIFDKSLLTLNKKDKHQIDIPGEVSLLSAAGLLIVANSSTITFWKREKRKDVRTYAPVDRFDVEEMQVHKNIEQHLESDSDSDSSLDIHGKSTAHVTHLFEDIKQRLFVIVNIDGQSSLKIYEKLLPFGGSLFGLSAYSCKKTFFLGESLDVQAFDPQGQFLIFESCQFVNLEDAHDNGRNLYFFSTVDGKKMEIGGFNSNSNVCVTSQGLIMGTIGNSLKILSKEAVESEAAKQTIAAATRNKQREASKAFLDTLA